MRRLNVRFTQVEECIEKSLFAVDALPRNPALQRGEVLLLQLVKEDAAKLGKTDSRVEFALLFDRAEADPAGALSKKHWPRAGKVWKYVLRCEDTVACVPFSLESLPLSQDYSGQGQCVLVSPEDEAVIRPFLQPGGASIGPAVNQRLLRAIRNYDMILRLSHHRTATIGSYSRRVSDPWPSDALKTLYSHRCQVCCHDFKPRYGVALADIRFITPIDRGGSLESRNRIVVCPNHNTILRATDASLDFASLSFLYPNGLSEKLQLTDHLVD